ncbi:hypothetical protein D7X33_14460 [Butyricicoccus sp. 1XD8-22]|nr:hypothetical protein D7X33_14460 [Butyricicoccus sp. 1XD8-22]
MNRYQKLLGNTMIFAIGTFSSKLLVFVMNHFYTAALTKPEYAVANIIILVSNIIIPVASLGISNAVIRYGVDKSNDQSEVFSISILTVLGGVLLLLPFYPLIGPMLQHFLPDSEILPSYVVMIYLYVLVSSIQSVCSQFVRALGHVRLYALGGVFRTVMTVVFNILFLSVWQIGIPGFVLSVVCSDGLAVVALSIIERLPQYFRPTAYRPALAKNMYRYAAPLIMTTICVWIFSSSDQFFISWLTGEETAAVFMASYKIPTILTVVSGIFIEAWQLSTFTNNTYEEQVEFFSKVGNAYQAIIFMMASGIVLFSQIGMSIIAVPSYFEGWRYIPLLIFATAFCCLSNFTNSVYALYKKTIFSFTSAVGGAIANLILNYILIKRFGGNGAALSTLLCYIGMFLARAIHSQRYLEIKWKIGRFSVTFLLLCLQSALSLLYSGGFWYPIQMGMFLMISAVNAQDILLSIKRVLRRA